MSNGYQDKVVVISGGSRGIGQAIGTAFAGEGASVILVASSAHNLAAAARAIGERTAVTPDICAADLRQLEGCETVHRHVVTHHGRCDILINSAGATRAGSFLDLPENSWQDGFALKFFGCVHLCRLFWPMLRSAQGHVVNVIGTAARTPDPEFLIGGAVNAAMSNFTKGLAGLGRRDGVNVNAILPGMTETERIHQLFQQRAEATGLSVDEVRAQQLAKDGIARLGRPEDVATLALFLCSDARATSKVRLSPWTVGQRRDSIKFEAAM